MSSKSSTSSEEDENFIKDVEDQKVLEVLTSHSKFKSLDDLVELRWYCMLVLIMAEITAFTALASVMVMVFAGMLALTKTIRFFEIFIYSFRSKPNSCRM